MTYISKRNGILMWHFLPDDGLTANGEGIKVTPGQTLKVTPPIEICSYGYHASERAIDALRFAPGALVCRVKLHGTVIKNTDKAVATHRTCLWMADATRTLHEFAIWCAEQALEEGRKCGYEPHADSLKALQIKRLWLDGKATDRELDAARDAARAAVWDAARAAARDAARDAAWDAARAAARAAARDAALAAAWDAAWAAARAAARDAAWAAAWAAARDAARDAAWDAQNEQLESMLAKLEYAEVQA